MGFYETCTLKRLVSGWLEAGGLRERSQEEKVQEVEEDMVQALEKE